MKQTMEPNPLRLSDQVRDLSDEIRFLAFAVAGLTEHTDNDADKDCNMLLGVARKLNDIGDDIDDEIPQDTAEVGL